MKNLILEHRKMAAYIAMSLVVIVWAFELIVGKIALAAVSPVQLCFLRFATSTLTMLIIMKAMKVNARIGKADIPLLILSAIVGTFIYFLAEYGALARISASTVSIILSMLPIISLLIEMIILRKKAGRKKILCVILSLAGASLVIGSAGLDFKLNILGFLLAFCAVVCWAASNYLLLSLLNKYSTVAVTFYRHLVTFLALIPLFVVDPAHTESFSLQFVAAVLFLGTFCNAFIFLVYGAVIKEIGTLPLSIFCNLLPVVTVAASFLILRERLVPLQWLGCIMVLLSIFLIIDYKKQSGEEPAPLVEEF